MQLCVTIHRYIYARYSRLKCIEAGGSHLAEGVLPVFRKLTPVMNRAGYDREGLSIFKEGVLSYCK